MATEQQIQAMLEAMTRQMDQVTMLQEENLRLRTQTVEPGTRTAHTKKPDRPTVEGGINDREWALFLDTWARYKQMASVTEVGTIRMELRSACSSDVNKMLFEFVGADVLDTCTEADLLGHIKSVAVKTVHKEVHQMVFNMMTQNEGESVTGYVARLKSQAFLCEFRKSCSCQPAREISFADEMVAQRLIAGLANQEHQRRVLSEVATLVTLEQKIERLRVLETTDESSTVLRAPPSKPSEASAARSQYQKLKKKTAETPKKEKPTCKWCGRVSHPGGKPLEKIHCPARQMECFKCKKVGHLEAVCESSAAAAAQHEQSTEEEEVPSNAAVSFSFDSEDFRPGKKKIGRR